MADWLGGLGPQETKALTGSALGTGAALYWRNPGTIIRALGMGGLGLGSGTVLGPDVHVWTGLSMQMSAALMALLAVPIALRLLMWAEKLDFGKMFKAGK